MITARVLQPGERIWRGDCRPSLIVPADHFGVICEGGCSWWTTRPTREHEAELARTTHLLSCHHDALLTGAATLHLADYANEDGLVFPRSA